MESVPQHEDRLLVEAIVGSARAAQRPWRLNDDEMADLQSLRERRLAGEPLQHLTGQAYFRYETLHVGPGVFIPRPETEVMTGWALDQIKATGARRVVELCAGSGAISLAIAHEHPGLEQWAVELSEDALPWLERNLTGTDVTIVPGNMATAIPELDGTVDLIVCNPPYIPLEFWDTIPSDVRDFDPHMALFSGDDGLDAMRTLVDVARRLLKPGGWLAAEHAEVQHESVVALFEDADFEQVSDHQDLTGRWRFVTARTAQHS